MKKVIKTLLQYVAVIVISLLIAAVLRLFVVDFYSIPSDSMEPAIVPGDFILVDKLSFGARMYRNFDFLEDGTEPETWRVKGFAPIRHGDVLVFNFPYSGGWNKISMHLSRFYVKRCIGLPGDTLLLCSDGLVNTVTDQEMLFEVIHGDGPDTCLDRLLAIARSQGAPDNVTAVLMQMQ